MSRKTVAQIVAVATTLLLAMSSASASTNRYPAANRLADGGPTAELAPRSRDAPRSVAPPGPFRWPAWIAWMRGSAAVAPRCKSASTPAPSYSTWIWPSARRSACLGSDNASSTRPTGGRSVAGIATETTTADLFESERAVTFELAFTSVAKDDERRVASRILIEDPVRLEAHRIGYGSRVTVSGPEDFSMEVKGAHTLQVLEIGLFVARTVLSTNSRRWIYEDQAGEPLDFDYEWPVRSA